MFGSFVLGISGCIIFSSAISRIKTITSAKVFDDNGAWQILTVKSYGQNIIGFGIVTDVPTSCVTGKIYLFSIEGTTE